MTLDVIYPSRKFVLPAIRHSSRDFRSFQQTGCADYRARPRETDQTRLRCLLHVSACRDDVSRFCLVWRWNWWSRIPRPAPRLFHFRIFGRVNNTKARTRASERVISYLGSFWTWCHFSRASYAIAVCSDTMSVAFETSTSFPSLPLSRAEERNISRSRGSERFPIFFEREGGSYGREKWDLDGARGAPRQDEKYGNIKRHELDVLHISLEKLFHYQYRVAYKLPTISWEIFEANR